LTKKVWLRDFGRGTTKCAVLRSLQRLQLPYLDLVLLHQPYGDCRSAWLDLEERLRERRVRAIGTSNFIQVPMKDLLQTSAVVPAVNQMEMHPYYSEARYAGQLKIPGITPQAWAPLFEGKRGIFHSEVLQKKGVTPSHSPCFPSSSSSESPR